MKTRHYYERMGSISPNWSWMPGLAWSGPADCQGLPRPAWRKWAGVISRRKLILKVTAPAKTNLQKPNPSQINTDIELLSPWSFRAWLVTRCLEKMLHKNTKNYIFWCLNCVYKITDCSCLECGICREIRRGERVKNFATSDILPQFEEWCYDFNGFDLPYPF